MKKEKGITLVSLVITIIIILIISSIAIFSGNDTIESAQITTFSTELQIIQQKVNVVVAKLDQLEEYGTEDQKKEYINGISKSMDMAITEGKLTETQLNNIKANYILLGESIEFDKDEKYDEYGYRYLGQNELEKINVTGVKNPVLINFNERKVISIKGVVAYDEEYKDNRTYHTLEQLESKHITGPYNVE